MALLPPARRIEVLFHPVLGEETRVVLRLAHLPPGHSKVLPWSKCTGALGILLAPSESSNIVPSVLMR